MDANGEILYKGGKNFNPAFVLNIASEANGTIGNNMVYHFGDKEFSIEYIQAREREEMTYLQWDAAVKDIDDYKFYIRKSEDGLRFTHIGTIQPYRKERAAYQYLDRRGGTAYYQIVVSGKKKNVNYYSKKIFVSDDNSVRVYPTVFSNFINIQLITPVEASSYKIENIQGQILQRGILKELNNTIEVNELASGVYYIRIQGGKTEVTRKIIKK
ncbi:MAG TPA: T9SS type A sorting domain-containing protein [Flavipsychrobacter sp.]|nr:T9SS type A sorting domain-containing protein [Flavipsychrobacter sp.]